MDLGQLERPRRPLSHACSPGTINCGSSIAHVLFISMFFSPPASLHVAFFKRTIWTSLPNRTVFQKENSLDSEVT
jgi:hypothetical protein